MKQCLKIKKEEELEHHRGGSGTIRWGKAMAENELEDLKKEKNWKAECLKAQKEVAAWRNWVSKKEYEKLTYGMSNALLFERGQEIQELRKEVHRLEKCLRKTEQKEKFLAEFVEAMFQDEREETTPTKKRKLYCEVEESKTRLLES